MENEIAVIENSITKDKEELIKSKLTEWAKINFNAENFGDKIKILSAKEETITKIDFVTRFVQRKFLDLTKPFNGETIPKKKGDLPDLWTFKTENINHTGIDIEENKGNLQRLFEKNAACYELPNTYELKVCPECVGKRKVICSRCDGSGRVLNYDNKREYCPRCNGARNLICGTCAGKGKVISYTALTEFFTFRKNTEFADQKQIPSKFCYELRNELNFFILDSFELNQNNYKNVLKSNETLLNNQNISNQIQEFIKNTGSQLNDNHRINKYKITISTLETQVVEYEYLDAKYCVVLYGSFNNVCAPDNTYPKDLLDNKTKIETSSKKEISPENISTKSRLITLLLCFFLGFLGAHRIYIGKKQSGGFLEVSVIISSVFFFLAKSELFALILLFCGVWIIIDFILILFGKFKDDLDKPVLRWI